MILVALLLLLLLPHWCAGQCPNFRAGDGHYYSGCGPGYYCKPPEINPSRWYAGECVICPRGYYCPGGKIPNVRSTGIYIRDKLKACPAGRYSGKEKMQHINACVKCLPGKYSKQIAQVTDRTCKDCPAGKYSEIGKEAGSTRCLECDSGKFSTALGATSSKTCNGCSAGKYMNGSFAFGLNTSSECVDCAAGRYSTERGGVSVSSCGLVEAGSYACMKREIGSKDGIGVGTGATASCKCPVGWYSLEQGNVNCTICPTGKYSTEEGSTFCADCIPGKYQNVSGSTSCLKCERGKYINLAAGANCILCPPGGFCAGQGMKNPVQCPPGQVTDASGLLSCKPCSSGRYQSKAGGAACTACLPGTYNANRSSTSEEACSKCLPGEYANQPGSASCALCPPGSFCETEGMKRPVLCPAGHFNTASGRTNCTVCPRGKWQSQQGSAICTACAAGTYNSNNGSTSIDSCVDCPAGTYANQEGTDQCHKCAKGQFQEEEGQTSCQVCSVVHKDDTLTSNADHTGCELNSALVSQTLVEAMFDDGVAMYGTAFVAAGFVLIAAVMQKKRERQPDKLATLEPFQALVKSFLPGFSFGSELFLIVGLIDASPDIAAAMIIFRLLHTIGAVALISSTFGGWGECVDENYLKGAAALKGAVESEFSRENVPVIAVLSIASTCDITMLQFMPWKKSLFYTESKGFPSMPLLRACLAIKTVQSTVSAICQLTYVFVESDLNDPTMSSQAKALFALNIIFSVTSAVMGYTLLLLKKELLNKLAEEEEEGKQEQQGHEGGDDRSRFDGLYPPLTSNPMHAARASFSRSSISSISSVGGGGGEVGRMEAVDAMLHEFALFTLDRISEGGPSRRSSLIAAAGPSGGGGGGGGETTRADEGEGDRDGDRDRDGWTRNPMAMPSTRRASNLDTVESVPSGGRGADDPETARGEEGEGDGVGGGGMPAVVRRDTLQDTGFNASASASASANTTGGDPTAPQEGGGDAQHGRGTGSLPSVMESFKRVNLKQGRMSLTKRGSRTKATLGLAGEVRSAQGVSGVGGQGEGEGEGEGGAGTGQESASLPEEQL